MLNLKAFILFDNSCTLMYTIDAYTKPRVQAHIAHLKVKTFHSGKVEEHSANLIGCLSLRPLEAVVQSHITRTMADREQWWVTLVIAGLEWLNDWLTQVMCSATDIWQCMLSWNKQSMRGTKINIINNNCTVLYSVHEKSPVISQWWNILHLSDVW